MRLASYTKKSKKYNNSKTEKIEKLFHFVKCDEKSLLFILHAYKAFSFRAEIKR